MDSVSDDELVGRLHIQLKQADLSIATTTSIRQKLENELGIELGERAAFIRHHMDAYLKCHHPTKISISLQNEESTMQKQEQQQEKEISPMGTAQEDLKVDNTTEEPVSSPLEGRKRGRPGGLNKVCGISPELQAIVGQATMPRTQIVKQLWVYIRENKLQDPSNKRNIICNDALRLVFNTDSTDMFQMNKLLARHIWAIDSADDCLEPNAKKIANGNAAGSVG